MLPMTCVSSMRSQIKHNTTAVAEDLHVNIFVLHDVGNNLTMCQTLESNYETSVLRCKCNGSIHVKMRARPASRRMTLDFVVIYCQHRWISDVYMRPIRLSLSSILSVSTALPHLRRAEHCSYDTFALPFNRHR